MTNEEEPRPERVDPNAPVETRTTPKPSLAALLIEDSARTASLHDFDSTHTTSSAGTTTDANGAFYSQPHANLGSPAAHTFKFPRVTSASTPRSASFALLSNSMDDTSCAAYLTLSARARRDGHVVQTTLSDVTYDSDLSDAVREDVMERLVDDLKDSPEASWRRWSAQVRITALGLLKALARKAGEGSVLSRPIAVRTLLLHSGLLETKEQRARTPTPPLVFTLSRGSAHQSPSHVVKEARDRIQTSGTGGFNLSVGMNGGGRSVDAQQEALRCLANTLLLFPNTRDILARLEAHHGCVRILADLTSPLDLLFYCARLLFLLTAQSSPLIAVLVEETELVETLSMRLNETLLRLQTADIPPMLYDLQTDILKVTFNVTLHYPRIKEAQELKSFDAMSILTTRTEKTIGTLASQAMSNAKSLPRPREPGFSRLLFPTMKLIMSVPHTQLRAPLNQAITVLLNFPVSAAWFPRRDGVAPSKFNNFKKMLRITDTSLQSHKVASVNADDLTWKLLVLVQDTFERYHHFGSNDLTAKRLAQNDRIEFEEILSPPVTLLANIATEDDRSRVWLRNQLFSKTTDRTIPLNKRPDFAARFSLMICSPLFPQLAGAVGELLFALCDKDAQKLSGEIGYGNAAGFLFRKGLMSAMPAVNADGSRAIDPMTGTYVDEMNDPMAGMSAEEKEAEADELFGLFDKLNKPRFDEDKDGRAEFRPKSASINGSLGLKSPQLKSPEMSSPESNVESLENDVPSKITSPILQSITNQPNRLSKRESTKKHADMQSLLLWSTHFILPLITLAVNMQPLLPKYSSTSSSEIVVISLQEAQPSDQAERKFFVSGVKVSPLSSLKSASEKMNSVYSNAGQQAQKKGRSACVGLYLVCADVGLALPIALDKADDEIFSMDFATRERSELEAAVSSHFISSVDAGPPLYGLGAITTNMRSRLQVPR